MFRTTSKLATALVTAALALPALAGQAAAADGKALFEGQKCTKCHSVKSEGIEGKKGKDNIIDISGTGARHDVAWFKEWLNKKVEMESQEKKGEKVKHKAKWKGTDEELDAMAKWLKGLTKK